MSTASVLNFDRIAWRWAVLLLLPVFVFRPTFGATFLVHEHDSHTHPLAGTLDDDPNATTKWHEAQHGDHSDDDAGLQSRNAVAEGAVIVNCFKVDSATERVRSATAVTTPRPSASPWDAGAAQIDLTLLPSRAPASRLRCCPRASARHAAAILLKSHALLI